MRRHETTSREQAREKYEPWFNPVFEPPNGEIEALFFSLQAAIGALILGDRFGYRHGHSFAGTPSAMIAGSVSTPTANP